MLCFHGRGSHRQDPATAIPEKVSPHTSEMQCLAILLRLTPPRLRRQSLSSVRRYLKQPQEARCCWRLIEVHPFNELVGSRPAYPVSTLSPSKLARPHDHTVTGRCVPSTHVRLRVGQIGAQVLLAYPTSSFPGPSQVLLLRCPAH